jgi:hypothetical protein
MSGMARWHRWALETCGGLMAFWTLWGLLAALNSQWWGLVSSSVGFIVTLQVGNHLADGLRGKPTDG